MNEGTLAILIQWCLLCLAWMGSLDRLLRELGVSRKRMLAVITAFLLCSFVSWELFVAPVQVRVSGTILPLLACGWLYGQLPRERRRLHILTATLIALLLFWFRFLFYTDPVLLFGDERVIVPAAAIVSIMMIGRHGAAQLFQLLFSFSMADLFHTFYFWKLSGTCVLGDAYAQDLMWSGVTLWVLVRSIWLTILRALGWIKATRPPSDSLR